MLTERGSEAQAMPGGRGQFDVVRDGQLVFSKHEQHRFPGEAEVQRLVSD